MPSDELQLIDLSSLFRPAFAMEPDNAVTKTLDRVRALAHDYPHTAICCDSGRSFRHDIDAAYKGQRPKVEAPLLFQEGLLKEQLRKDDFPVWAKSGFEADDIIASATTQALAMGGDVLIVTADKDLLQLVGPHVQVLNPTNGQRRDVQWVKDNVGIEPSQIVDYLSLTGDASDNITGAKGIGPKKAAAMLQTFGSLQAIYDAIDKSEAKLPAGILNALHEFRDRWPNVRELVTLRTDIDIPFSEIAAERVIKDAVLPQDELQDEEPTDDTPEPVVAPTASPALPMAPTTSTNVRALTSKAATVSAPMPTDWGRQLEPRSYSEAVQVARHMFAARLFSGYGTEAAVLSTILAGRELGMNAVASLRAFHIIEGKHSLAAEALRALVLRSGLAKYFRCVEHTQDRCTYETWRQGDPEPTRITYTIEQGRQASLKDDRAWKNSSWGRHPDDMLSARASSQLARMVYPDLLYGLYATEELTDDVQVEAMR